MYKPDSGADRVSKRRAAAAADEAVKPSAASTWRPAGVVGLSDRMNHYPSSSPAGKSSAYDCASDRVRPTFLLCDEPTRRPDRKSADEIMKLIDELWEVQQDDLAWSRTTRGGGARATTLASGEGRAH